jgi:Protein of unknown function (DUF4239)
MTERIEPLLIFSLEIVASDAKRTAIVRTLASLLGPTRVVDNLLAQYGPDTNDVRNLSRRGIVVLADRMWREKSSEVANTKPFEASAASDAFFAKLQQLSPQNDTQRALQARAIQIATDIAQTRLLLFAQTNNSIPMPFLVVLIFWLTIIFGSFGLFAKPSATVFSSLFVFALSAAGAIYLVLELGQPFAGLMQISSAPLRSALTPFSP